MENVKVVAKKRTWGRPKGTVLSQDTKDKIAASRRGQKHSDTTRAKISIGVKNAYQKYLEEE